MKSRFELIATDTNCQARAGSFYTDHGVIETPIFMPVGTSATVKAVHQTELKHAVKAQIILGNTYHLYLRPGTEIIEKAGGLHGFMNWDKPLLTDSGGYQVFSLSANRKIKEEGVIFSSHIDGSKHLFTPASVVDIQRSLGSDIMMALDECPPYPSERAYVRRSMNITHRWLEAGINHFEKTNSLYGHRQCYVPISQGSVYEDLRIESIQAITQYSNPIYAIGGLSVGEPEEELNRLVAICCQHMPVQSARYLMGVGTPQNLLNSIERGIDFFDCVLPTRNARHGIIYTTQGIIHIRNLKWKDDFSPIDEKLDLQTSQQHSKSYLRHLIMSNEILGAQLASLQNLRFYLWLMEESRNQILKNNFKHWKDQILPVISARR
ncbi:MAG: tRNA guanosine(34) transglycosylase Tgt [Saprospiraceae bacterium]|nr:tRNA guanosine(34) transglycosylase Tgt [Saprospiraceae bacterium]MBK7738293.1 tRNA guanosine(34) transglycosylase Tgt [Saprospiraceae bacterium]MBK7913134.1 tRNA guanosine(34) transglycosylase Tgt [Saprospiraceae bacterium]